MIGIITAAGDCKRFGGRIKALLPVHGETIVERDVRLFGKRMSRFYLATHHTNIQVPGLEVFHPAQRRFKLETMISTASLWDEDVMFLHGDVYFADNDADKILNPPDQVAFFLNGNEHFALFIPFELQPTTLNKMVTLVQHTKPQSPPASTGIGSLLGLFRKEGIGHEEVTLDGGTMDFDCPVSYDRWAALNPASI